MAQEVGNNMSSEIERAQQFEQKDMLALSLHVKHGNPNILRVQGE